jgi:outer membrane protein TolC
VVGVIDKRNFQGVLKSRLGLGFGTLIISALIPCQAQTVILPEPAITHTMGSILTMHDAVLLTLRNSPNIISAELDRVTQKYSLILARSAYLPQFSLGGVLTANSGSSATASINPAASINQSPIGVTGSLAYNPNAGSMNLTLNKQLWAGNSYTAYMNPLWSAQENAIINRMAYRDSIVTAIHTTTQAYRTLASSLLTLTNDKAVLHSDLEQLSDAKLKLKLGRGTQFDVNQSKLDVASDKSTLITDQQAIEENMAQLSEALGLDPEVKIHITTDIPFPIIHLGTLQDAVREALTTSTAYKQAQITSEQAKRQLIIDKNAAKPSLAYQLTDTIGGNTPGPHLTNAITWGIPINNVQNKYNILSDRINIIKDQQTLESTRNTIVSTVTQDYNNLKQAVASWDLAQARLALNIETVKQQTAQYEAGQLDLYSLSTAKQSLTATRNNLQTTKNSLWSDLESFRTDTGSVLSSFGISLESFNE